MFLWLTVTMPFGPLLLDLNGFYKFPLQKSVLKSLAQTAQALVWLTFLIDAADLGTSARPSPTLGWAGYFCHIPHANERYRAGDRRVRDRRSRNLISISR
jgi:hypothetical protein